MAECDAQLSDWKMFLLIRLENRQILSLMRPFFIFFYVSPGMLSPSMLNIQIEPNLNKFLSDMLPYCSNTFQPVGAELRYAWILQHMNKYIGYYNLPMADLQKGLLGRGKKETSQMQKKFQQCEIKIKTLCHKNNELQKQSDNDLMDKDIKAAIKAQTAFIQHEINDLKKALEQLSKNYTDQTSKHKIKEIWKQASREMQRNKRIMQDFMNRASTSPSIYRRDSANPFLKSRSQVERDQSIPLNKDSNSIFASEDMVSEIKAQQKILAQRNALLKQLEQKNIRIKEIINDMGDMVGGEQKDLVSHINDNLIAVKQNMQDANEELNQANVYQKKSKKKYICLISIIIVILLIAVGLIYFLVIGK